MSGQFNVPALKGGGRDGGLKPAPRSRLIVRPGPRLSRRGLLPQPGKPPTSEWWEGKRA
jgi:hypothetical protein